MHCCIYCGEPFESARIKGYHQRYCPNSPNYEKRKLVFQLAGKMTSIKNKGRIIVPRKIYEFTCEKCGASFTKELTATERMNMKHFFCSRKCANSRERPESVKNKIRASVITTAFNKKVNQDKEHCYLYSIGEKHILHFCIDCHTSISNKAIRCMSCNRKFYNTLNHDKIQKMGLKAAQVNAEKMRSKNEIAFYNKCENYFNNVRHNVAIFNGWDADVIVDDYKIAVLWNGPWHYKQISNHQSLKQVQTRDAIKIKEITNMGYIPYIIKDMGAADMKKVDIEFDKFLVFVETIKNK